MQIRKKVRRRSLKMYRSCSPTTTSGKKQLWKHIFKLNLKNIHSLSYEWSSSNIHQFALSTLDELTIEKGAKDAFQLLVTYKMSRRGSKFTFQVAYLIHGILKSSFWGGTQLRSGPSPQRPSNIRFHLLSQSRFPSYFQKLEIIFPPSFWSVNICCFSYAFGFAA